MKFNKLLSKFFLFSIGTVAFATTAFFITSCSNTPSAPQIRYAFAENVFCNIEPTDLTKDVNRSKLEIFNIFDKQAPRASGEPMLMEQIAKTLNTIIYMDLALTLSNSIDVNAFSITNCKTDIQPNKLDTKVLIKSNNIDVSNGVIIQYASNKDDVTKVDLNIELIDDPTNPITMPSYIYRNTPIKPTKPKN